ncbi:MAG TPA: polysaccharide biosynthesis/export family protein [Candidatus Binatia bacterium]|jgi:polysaccharide export outer membrane protein
MKYVKAIILAASISAVLMACSTKDMRVRQYQLSSDVPNPAKPPDEFYVIGSGDSLEIVVWKEPTLSGAAKVRPDGYITLPLVHEVQAAGLTTAQLRKILEDKYRDFVSSPFVSIRVTEITSTEIFLVGQVNKPGAYQATGHDTILQLITRAGGLSLFADYHNIKVVRRNGADVTEYTVDFEAIMKGDLKQDIVLRPGDRILVD